MTRFGGTRPLPRPAVALASASSCALLAAAAFSAVTPPVVAGALCAAAATAVLSTRGSRPAELRLLAPLPGDLPSTPAVVTAPQARELAAAGPSARSDAA